MLETSLKLAFLDFYVSFVVFCIVYFMSFQLHVLTSTFHTTYMCINQHVHFLPCDNFVLNHPFCTFTDCQKI